nr:von Willebrand factor A domain-containing protein 7-like isoform X1 [Cherax quadricarinatus]
MFISRMSRGQGTEADGSSSPISCFPLLLFLMALTPLPSSAFLGRGTLLETQDDVFGIYCAEFDRGTRVWHHREITREAIRRAVVRYFKEVTPEEGTYNHRDGMTLEEAYAEYYGSSTSSKPFLDAVSTLVDSVAEADTGVLGTDPRYHFRSERFSESQQMLEGRWRRALRAANAGDYSGALHLLGLSLAAIQDFYSCTNWVELGNTDFNPDIGIPGKDIKNVASIKERTCKDCPEAADGIGSCHNNILQEILDSKKLTSSYNDDSYVNNRKVEKPKDVDKCSHGGPRDKSGRVGARGGINKDLPTACFSPHHYLHEQAAQQAVRASEYYINLMRGGVGDTTFSRLLGLHPTPALVIVVDTTESMDEELAVLTHSISRLVRQHDSATYPPAEYILVPFGDPSYGPVIRSLQPEDIYTALTKLTAAKGGDEAELSMSGLRLALHHSPPHSQVFLFTDASIKDPELFATVITLALSKSIKVTPVLTMPVQYGGISGKISLKQDLLQPETNLTSGSTSRNTSSRIRRSSDRRKRQLQSFGKYSELAHRTGGQLIETTFMEVGETARILEAEQYPMAVLRRVSDVTSPQTVKMPVDSLVTVLEVSISGGAVSAVLLSPSGARFDLVADASSLSDDDYTVVVATHYHIQVRINMAQRRKDVGEWTLKFEPINVSSAVVYARTSLDIMPVFYTPDAASSQPSMQRVQGEPSPNMDTYLDIIMTGVDTAGLKHVQSVLLLDDSGQELVLDLPSNSPRRNTYLSLPSQRLPKGRFTVVVSGEDSTGVVFRREGGRVWETVKSSLTFSLGRDIWGPPGSVLTIPVSITNTDTSTATAKTYFITAYDALGSVVSVDHTRLQLGRNETTVVSVRLEINSQVSPHTTNSLLVTATSTQGDTSHTHAHVSVTSLLEDGVPPGCNLVSKSSCDGHLTQSTCSSLQWNAGIYIHDDIALSRIETVPASNPPSVMGMKSTTWNYQAQCCSPHLKVTVYDVSGNVGFCTIYNGDVTDDNGNVKLSKGAIAGITVGSVLGGILLIIIIVLVVIRLRRSKKEDITLRRAARRDDE